MKLIFKKLKENAVIPHRATAGSAGFDLSACIDNPITLLPGQICSVSTGLAVQPECGDAALLIFPRSGLASKHGVSLANCVGVVDIDYRGEILVPLINHGSKSFTVENGMRIAQLVVTPVIIPEIS